MDLINEACEPDNEFTLLQLCTEQKMPYLGMFLSTAFTRQRLGMSESVEFKNYYDHFINTIVSLPPEPPQRGTTVKLLCDWTSTAELTKLWSKMKPDHCKLELITEGEPDYWVIINGTESTEYVPARTIAFHMEPSPLTLDTTGFLKVFDHDKDYNNVEWHLSKSWSELYDFHPDKTKVLSTVLSSKFTDPGHVKRVTFVKELEKEIGIDVFGSNVFRYKQYRGSLPYHEKDNAVFPYKYHFNAENHSKDNYATEKLIDAIMGECLCFYWGCPNLGKFIDYRSFLMLDLDDIPGSIEEIRRAIANDEWSKRIQYIRAAKKKILDQMTMFDRVSKLFPV
jgi:hypothetical protein